LEEYAERSDLNENAEMLADQLVEDLIEWLPLSKKDYMKKHKDISDWIKDEVCDLFEKIEWSKDVIPARYFKWSKPEYDITDLTDDSYELVWMMGDNAKKRIAEKYKNWEITDDMDFDMSDPNDVDSMISNYIFKYIYERIEQYIDENWDYSAPADSTERWKVALFLMSRLEIPYEKSNAILDKIFWSWAKDRPLTPENVVEAMKNQRVNREVEPGSFRDMIEIEWHELKDVEEARKQNFAKVFQWDWTWPLGDLERRYDNLIKLLAEENNWLDWNSIDDNNVTDDLKYTISKSYDPDPAKFKEQLIKASKEEWFVGDIDYNEEVLKRIIDVVEQGKKVPIRFAESKPERVVDLYNEVKYVLVPKGDVNKAKKIVKWTPLENKIVEYTPDNKTAPRSRKIKELQKLYWDVFFQMWWVIMPIAMLLKMADAIWWWDDDEEEA
jgi:hypothetical protein